MKLRFNFKKHSLSLGMAVILLPRIAASMPLYSIVAALLAIDSKSIKKTILICAASLLVLSSLWLVIATNFRLSLVAFLIEFILLIPMILLAFNPYRSWQFDAGGIEKLNYLAFIFSILNMIIYFGFPMALPYRDFLPDAFAAFWGSGGVKIITLIGFFGLASNFLMFKQSLEVNKLFLLVCAANFLIPNYNIGIASGLVGFALIFVRHFNFKRLIMAAVVSLVLGAALVPYVSSRLDGLNSIFVYAYGSPPKIYGYTTVLRMMAENPGILFTGTGLGNFSGTAALWASESIASLSAHGYMKIPGLFESELHQAYLAPALSIAYDSSWALSSSLNKPYATISTLLAELGLPLSMLLLFGFFKSLRNNIFDKSFSLAVCGCIGSLFILDNLHSNPLFWASICIGLRAGHKGSN